MKILLIQAWRAQESALRNRFSGLIAYSSLTLAVLISLIPDGMFETVDVVDEYSQKVEYDRQKYDLVLISFDTSSAVSAYRHCDSFRRRGAYVAVGGYHATALPEEAAKHCDTVLSGPAEHILPAFLHDFAAGHPKAFYRDADVSATEYRFPARDQITKKGKQRTPAVIANRGCINNCNYCSMRTMWKSDPRPVDDVIREIKSLHTKTLVFYDPNFFADRDYAIRLMKRLRPLKILWACTATADIGLDHELMDLAYQSGCRGFVLGLESLNAEALTHVRKRFREPDRYQKIVSNIHSHGIAVQACFVLGFDDDCEADLLALPERIRQIGADLCKFSILTPYPGTKIYAQYEKEGRILSKNWDLYNQHHTVIRHPHISPKRLDAIYRDVWKRAFSWRAVLGRVLHSPCRGYVRLVLLGANIGFKFVGIEHSYR